VSHTVLPRGHVGRPGRALAIGVLGLLLFLAGARASRADAVVIPAELQAGLLAKLVTHDRNFAARAGDLAQVLLVVRAKNVRSMLAVTTMKSALSQIERLGTVPHRETIVEFDTPSALAAACRASHVAVVYLGPGFDEDVEGVGRALSGVDVLSVSAVPEYVPRGIVLGFELVSGKPKILLNLAQAKLQNVNFKADVISLMRVYR
jgi:hypothetical protein